MATVRKIDRSAPSPSAAPESDPRRAELVQMLTKAYWMEMETVMSYVANSINPDGVRSREVAEALEADILEELGHARQFAERIKELWGIVPGSMEFRAEQRFLQPPERTTDVAHIVRGVIEAERGAVEHYRRIADFCDDFDLVTQDMVVQIQRDEERHLRLFEGFLREFEVDGIA